VIIGGGCSCAKMVDEKSEAPPDSEMHIANVHGIFDE
jgi:hypothetical protein